MNIFYLCYREANFEIMTDWHNFSFCNGKSLCDEIGGNEILTPLKFFQFGKENIKGIKFFYVEKVDDKDAKNAFVGTRKEKLSAKSDKVVAWRLLRLVFKYCERR